MGFVVRCWAEPDVPSLEAATDTRGGTPLRHPAAPGRWRPGRISPVPDDPPTLSAGTQDPGRLPTDRVRAPAPGRLNALGQPIGQDVDYSGASAPTATTLRGRRVWLVPLREEHAGDLLTAMRSAGGDELWTYLGFPPCRTTDGLAACLRTLLGDDGKVFFALQSLGGPAAGDASLRGSAPVVGMLALQRCDLAMGSVEVAFVMYGEGARRATPGTEAIYLVARYVFEDLGFRRLEWKCDALHAGSRRAAARYGFGYEGIWRNAIVVKSRARDTAWYAMTDHDWALLRPGYEAWLAQCHRADCRPLRDFLP